MGDLVTIHHDNGVLVVTVDNPPVNALGSGVQMGIHRAISAAKTDATVDAIVIAAAGKTYIAGADIKELQASTRDPEHAPDLHPLLDLVENCPKPVVVAMHGTALGGGLELAMACHYRIAQPDAQIGAPEAKLGIILGAEGTQRMPRLVGVAHAVDLCISGRWIGTAEALKIGLIDRVAQSKEEGAPLAEAIAFAREMVGKPPRRTGAIELLNSAENQAAIKAGYALAARTRPRETSPLLTLEALEAAITLPFEEGCKKERGLAMKAIGSPQAPAFMRLFFAERAVAKVPGIAPDLEPYAIRKIAIIGAGTMGAGIAMACVNAGIPVLLKDTAQAGLDRGVETIRKNYARSVQRGRTPQAVMDQRMAMIHPQLDYAGFEDADLIIEAAFENMALKQDLFRAIDKIAKPDCVLATNTSTLDIDEIAAATARPQMVVGLHFFSPANVMRLVEIVRGAKTGDRVLVTALALAKNLNKVGVVVGNCYGFVGNRMMFAYMREAQFLVEEGALPEQVDHALTEFGMAMGIFAVDDLGGIDLLHRVRQEAKHLDKPGVRKPVVHERMFETGRYGQKTGAGWYRYGDGGKPHPDPFTRELVEKTSAELGFTRRAIGDEEIIERCIYAMVNEGAKILAEGHAAHSYDIDVIYTTGYGFPAWRGGPMWYADSVGLRQVYQRICDFEQQFGADLWAPAPLLKQLAEAGSTFAAWDQELGSREDRQ